MDANAGSGVAPHAAVIPPTLYLLIAVLVIGRFLLRELRERKLPLSRLFLPPIVLSALAAYLLYFTATHFAGAVVLLAGETCITLGIGAGVGLAVGHFTTVRLGEKPGLVYVRGSYQSVAIWVAALALRYLARFAIGHDDLAAQMSGNAALVVMIAVALFMLRYRVLVDARSLQAQNIMAPVNVV